MHQTRVRCCQKSPPQLCSLAISSNTGRHLRTRRTGMSRQGRDSQPLQSSAGRRAERQPCSATTTSKEYQTFTNPAGNVLNQIAENVWGAERPFIWNTIDVNGRMAVLRLNDGTVWVHSPVGLDDQLKKALVEIGQVKHVVSPNFEHVSFAKQWQEAYPEAILYACPGLRSKQPDVKFDVELSGNDRAPQEWSGEVECTCLTYERNPFNGKPFFNEVVFFHKPSRLLIVSDLFWNYPKKGTQLGTQAWKLGMDKVYAPFYRSFMIREKDDFEVAKRRMFDEWDFDGIVPCHGDVLATGGKDILRQHLGLKN